MKMSKIFADFKRINTQCELRRTLEFMIGKTTYRVEVLYCYSNPKSPWSAQAYDDNPLPIGEGQTISQPYIVALMLEMLEVSEEDIVLEIGTGSGYQTALLAQLSRHVYSIERHATLAAKAQAALAKLGYTNVTIEVGDGSKGLSAHAPFDGIVVSAAAPDLPPALFEQLKEGGRLVVPVGPTEAQFLQLVTKKEGKPVLSEQIPCRFVPLIGEQGYRA